MNVEEVLGAFSLVNNPILLSEEEIKDVQKAIKQLQHENQELKQHLEELKNRYKIKLEKLLANNIEPDLEDFYLAEIECKANAYDKLINQHKNFLTYLEKKSIDSNPESGQQYCYREVLNAYKKIIGDVNNEIRSCNVCKN